MCVAAAAADGCLRWETVRETAGGRGLDTGYPRSHTQTGRGSGDWRHRAARRREDGEEIATADRIHLVAAAAA